MKNFFLLIAIVFIQEISSQNQFIDTSFGTNSGYTISQMAPDDFAFTSIIQHNNSIYAVHSRMGGDLYLSKYNLNGIIDFNFGSNGFVAINSNLTNDPLFQGRKNIFISSDNKLIITSSGRAVVSTEAPDTIVGKLNLDGTFDVNYGINGHVVTNFTYGQSLIGSYKYPEDDILLVFNKTNSQPIEVTELTLVKINATGNYDFTFGTNGKITLPFDYNGYIPQLAIIKDQSVYIQFSSSVNPTYIKKFDLLTSNYDVNFGVNGKLTIQNIFPYQSAGVFTIDENNAIFVTGSYLIQGQTSHIFVFKYTDGILDSSFGTNGSAQTTIATSNTAAYSITRFGDKLFIMGEGAFINEAIGTSFLAQLNIDGTLDPNFGQNGIIINEIFDDIHLAFDYIYLQDSIISGGFCPIGGGEYRPCLTKYIINNNLSSHSTTTNNFSYYPNPVTSELRFRTNEDVIKIAIYDILGRLIKSAKVSQNKSDLSELTSGTYIVKAQTTNKTHTFKVNKK